MARTDNFTNFATDVANSIREKTGETGLIPASEFDTKIKSIQTGVDPSGLQDKDVEINENGVTTVTADEGFDGLNSVDITINVPTNETPVINNAIDIIRNGVENTNLTGGHTYESVGGDGANFKEIQNTGYVTLTAKQWNRCWWKTVDKIDFKPFKTCKIYVDYSADKLSDTDASLYEWGVVLCESETVLKLDHKPIVDGVGTFTRNVCEIDITDILPILHEEYFVLQVANLTAQTSYTKYGVNVYNVWLEGEVDTENMIVNITENGTTLITPSEGYRALNSVEINVEVESNLQDKTVEITKNSVTTVTADEGFDGLNSVEIVTNVSGSGDTTIGDGLISGTLLEYASNNLTIIRDYAFYYNNTIKAISAPNVKSIAKYAFYKTTYLQTITIPSVTSIREQAFYNSAVREINVPVLTTLGDKAFYGCSLLTTFNAPLIETLGSNAFQNCSKLQTVHIPNIKSISHYCFSSCSKLESIDLHNCTAINHYAFQSCNALASLILRSSTLCTLGVYVFSSTSPIALGTGYIYVPSALLEDYKTATNWSDYASQFKTIEELPDTDV